MQLIPNNPLSDIYAKEDLQITKRSVDRTFSDEEIRMFWLAVDQSRITPSIEGYLKEAFELSAQNSYVFTNDGSDEVMGLRAALAIPYNIMQYLRKNEGYELAHFFHS